MKIFKFVLFLLIIFLLVDYFGRSSLVKEIANLENPVIFERTEIDSIAQKYFSLGNTKEQVIDSFKSYGFKVLEESVVPGFHLLDKLKGDCNRCDDIVVGIYDFKFLYIMPTYRIVIDIGFQNERVVMIKGTYLQHSLP